jgi:hypothetical protein
MRQMYRQVESMRELDLIAADPFTVRRLDEVLRSMQALFPPDGDSPD